LGKKRRELRRERREDFASKRTHQKRKSNLLAGGILGLIAVIVGFSIYTFIDMDTGGPGVPEGAGKLGDEHEHASLLVRIFGDKFDFSTSTYQIKNSWIHFEESDGSTIHRHSSGVTLEYLFDSLNLSVGKTSINGVLEDCFAFPESDGRKFCTNEDYSLKFYINHQAVGSLSDYVIEDGDRILISYGNETEEQINEQLMELDAQIIND
jgi:hypothetical protein